MHRLTRMRAITALAIAIAATIAAIVEYWEAASTQVLGGLAALASIAGGAALVLWVHGYMSEEEVEGERETLAASDPEWDELASAVAAGRDRIGRRRVLAAGLLVFVGAIAAALISFMRSIVGLHTSFPGQVLWHTPWATGKRLSRLDGTFIKDGEIPVDSVVIAFPEGAIGSLRGAVMLINVKESLLELPAAQKGWAVRGQIAYSRICTHAGCPVSQYEDTVHLLGCPCHQSTFDVLKGAVPTGGPATRPLPQLPLGVDSEGYLIAQSDFTRPVGPGFGGILS